jgi:hypothetical protein
LATARPRQEGGMIMMGVGLVMLIGGLIRFAVWHKGQDIRAPISTPRDSGRAEQL